jgi:hypothetical protein
MLSVVGWEFGVDQNMFGCQSLAYTTHGRMKTDRVYIYVDDGLPEG